MNCSARHGYRQHHTLRQRELGQWAAGLELGLTPLHQRIVHTLDWLDIDSLLGYAGARVGAPERSRFALAQAFVCKAVLGFEQTTQLRSRLAVDSVLRRLLGFESNRRLPSEATFSRAFAEFARIGLAARAHEALIRKHLGQSVIGHIASDATAIPARERAQYSAAETAASRVPKVTQRRGRPPQGAAPGTPRSRFPAQLRQTPEQALAELPQLC